MGQDADNEGDGEKDPTSGETLPDPSELELLQEIIDPAAHNRLPPAPKSGDKRGPSHLDSGSASSDSSVEDLDAKGVHPKKKGSTPTKVPVLHPSQWAEEDIDVVRQTRYKTDLQCFQTYCQNKIDPGDMASINTKDHSAYIEVAQADPGSVIRKSVFSIAAYREVNVCQCENGVNVKYSDSDGFGHPGTMGLWDLHSSNALNRAKMQLPSSSIDTNFCPCCMFYLTNNKTLNNHVHKHYEMGLTCQSDGFMTASMRTDAVKKLKGKG